jgi:Arc/MetJ family transcription regulator
MRTTFTLDDALAEEAHRYGVPLSASAREGVEAAVRRAKEAHDRQAYLMNPEAPEDWSPDEAWSDEVGGE